MVDTTGFVTALVINGAIAIVFITLFIIWKPKYPVRTQRPVRSRTQERCQPRRAPHATHSLVASCSLCSVRFSQWCFDTRRDPKRRIIGTEPPPVPPGWFAWIPKVSAVHTRSRSDPPPVLQAVAAALLQSAVLTLLHCLASLCAPDTAGDSNDGHASAVNRRIGCQCNTRSQLHSETIEGCGDTRASFCASR